ncbi:SulP family inorganic anion transporter [Pontibacter sp. G13]|uniref:SulP family inorganic anion transporter n=1 Tax=Pontibacter sp. G13 TaxID=3074898 RepID=UPI00288A5755|nr:SulP family inorganic anion transporter [Pontibacter sp. G13]WNJ20862.1 SulP family inorganic anion transporter [Pontibacter sp. G13]
MQNQKSGFFANLSNDIPASIVVFLVAIPLCLGIALASGAPPLAGIIAGFVGGIIVSLISKSPLGVSGPAAGLAVIVLNAITDLPSFEIFLVAVVFAGVIQIILSIIKAGVIGYYFPNSVIKGMLAGIGVIIFWKQVPIMFGHKDTPKNFTEFFEILGNIAPGALVITLVSLAILILWEQPFIKKISFMQWIQGPLVAVVVGIILQLVFAGSGSMALAEKQLVELPMFDGPIGFFTGLTFPDFKGAFANTELLGDILLIGATLAIVASLETLLCVEATDKLDPQKRITPTNRELLAQGAGNMVSGLIGGLPVTQVIVRSSANIQAGGKTRAAAFFHGIWVLLAVVFLPSLLRMIPLASLAGILMVVGYKLAKPSLVKSMWKLGWMQFVPFMVTIVGIVGLDLLKGIGLGLAVAILIILLKNYQTPYFFDPEKHEEGDPYRIMLSEDVTFLNKASILNTFKQIPDGSKVIIDSSKNVHVDNDVLEIIEEFKTNALTRGIEVTEVKEVNGLAIDAATKFKEVVGTTPNGHPKQTPVA